MTQRTFAELAYEAKKRKTRREVFDLLADSRPS
jgi:hypothetical protein